MGQQRGRRHELPPGFWLFGCILFTVLVGVELWVLVTGGTGLRQWLQLAGFAGLAVLNFVNWRYAPPTSASTDRADPES
jgi:membrane protein implicated in regulation of membrane protease activity